MKHDLLVDKDRTIYAVNCTISNDDIAIGALYAEPGISDFLIRLSDKSASVVVELPVDLVHQSTFTRAWNITLPIAPNE
jgi:hypothetical protein